MNIVMHCLGLPFNGDTLKTKSLGGSESAAYYLARELADDGHRVTLFTSEPEGGKFDGVTYIYAGERTDRQPLGLDFHHYAENTPHDVLIIQRHPQAFSYKYASKINLLWLHDVPNKEQIGLINSQMWNIQGILSVSEYHKDIIAKTYKIDPNFIYSIENGVDPDLYQLSNIIKLVDDEGVGPVIDKDKFNMIYSSRPERGLEFLVREDGIMDQLLNDGSDKHLYVCGYDNVTEHMRDYYNYLWSRCEKLSNVTNLGSLTKSELAILQTECDLAIYPTEFEEVSCITAMECMFARLPLLTSKFAVLPETCKESGTILVTLKSGKVDESRFIAKLKGMTRDSLSSLRDKQVSAAKGHTWASVKGRLIAIVDDKFAGVSIGAKAKELMRRGDIFALNYLLKCEGSSSIESDLIMNSISKEMELYKFAFENTFSEHYKEYYEYEKNRGVDYGPEELAGNMRFEVVAEKISHLPDGSSVLDYGCAHGHYTINLAKRFPKLNFIGIDIAQSNIDKAIAWTLADKVPNVAFNCGTVVADKRSIETADARTIDGRSTYTKTFNAIIAAEVIEHVDKPVEFIAVLNDYLIADGLMILTTPYGTWEYIAAKEHHPWRAHVHHFDRDDLHNIFGHCDNFKIAAVPSGQDKFGEALGSYVTSFTRAAAELGSHLFGSFNYDEKIRRTVGRETVSVCMIAKDCEANIRRSLDSIVDIADEVLIGVDSSTSDRTGKIIASFSDDNPLLSVSYFPVEPAIESGFDEARNKVCDEACGDWILWLDTDEVFDQAHLLARYLRNNQHAGLAVAQHHFAMEPAGIIKTDLPTRLYRNHIGIKFRGVVHEHPEVEMNKGVPYCARAENVAIGHVGYQNEEIRRKRFERNIGLMVRDREENPERLLGKFLWIRDLSQMCMFELERTGQLTPAMIDRANEGLRLWHELLDDKHLRLAVDSLDFISSLNKIRCGNNGFEFKFKFDIDKRGQADLGKSKEVVGYFDNRDDVEKLLKLALDDRLQVYNT